MAASGSTKGFIQVKRDKSSKISHQNFTKKTIRHGFRAAVDPSLTIATKVIITLLVLILTLS